MAWLNGAIHKALTACFLYLYCYPAPLYPLLHNWQSIMGVGFEEGKHREYLGESEEQNGGGEDVRKGGGGNPATGKVKLKFLMLCSLQVLVVSVEVRPV